VSENEEKEVLVPELPEVLGLTVGQVLTLAGVCVILLALLWVVKQVYKLTRALLGLGCLGILVLLAIAFFVLRGW
jgi:hypothetical protein